MRANMKALCGHPLAAPLLILVSGALAYANTFGVPFVFDDEDSIVRNSLVHGLDRFFADGAGLEAWPTRFVAYLSFALNHHIGGLEVAGYHAVNLGIHLANALLVHGLLLLTFRTPYFAPGGEEADPFPGARRLIPLFAALLFVVHPVQTQAVTYIVQRLASLATFFYLLSIVLYAAARQRSEARERGLAAPLLLLAGSTVSAVLAMKTKEIAFTLPLAALLYEALFFRGPWRRRLLWLLPLLATLPIIPGALVAGGSAAEILSDVGEKSRVQTDLSRSAYLFTEFRVIVTYLRLLVLPAGQNLDYDYPVSTTFFSPGVLSSFLLLAALFALGLWLWFSSRRKPGGGRLVSFGILWFFLTLSVESSVIPIVDVIFEHRLYLPSAGAAAAFSTALFLLGGRVCRTSAGRRAVTAAALAMAVVLGVATFQRNALWGDPVSLWRDTAAKSPRKARPYNNLGIALLDAGRLEEAIGAFSRAIEVDPLCYRAWNNLGYAHIMSGRSGAAIPMLEQAIRMAPEFVDPYLNLAGALNQLHRFREAADFVERNLPRVGGRIEAHYHLGVAHAFLGNREVARRQMEIVALAGVADLTDDLARLLGTPGVDANMKAVK